MASRPRMRWSQASLLREVKRRIRPLFAAGAGGFLGGPVPGRPLRPGAAQDRLDAGRGGRRPWPLAAAGHSRPRPLRPTRSAMGARLRARCWPIRMPCWCSTRPAFRRCASAAWRGRTRARPQQDHQLPDRGLRRLRVPARPRLHRPGPVPAQGLAQVDLRG